MDYKDFVEGKYPEPDKRLTSKDFPDADELFVYGEDRPVPESDKDLRCRYNHDDKFPLVFTDLEGYKVPPLGLTAVWVNGGGGKKGFAYPPGTFREDKFTVDKEFGADSKEMVIAREQSKKDAIIDVVSTYLENKGILTLDVMRDKSPQMIAAAVLWALGIIDDSGSPREALNMAKWLESKVSQEGETLGKATKKSTFTLDEAREWLKFTKEAREQLLEEQGDIVTLEFVKDEE